MTRCLSTRGILAAVLMGLAAAAMVGNFAAQAALESVAIGQTMPDFQLKDLDGNQHRLSQYKGKVIVLDFCSHKCPWSRGADPAIVELAQEYTPKGVVFLGIDSHRSTPVEEIKPYANEQSIPFAVLKDEGNVYSDKVGATRTPEIYILDTEMKLAYQGAFDNRKEPEQRGETNYVSKALDNLLAGEPVATPKISAWGCTIKRARAAAASEGSAPRSGS